ncbi:MAG: ABC transporter permease [Nocardioidaceae bacterium]
MAKLDLLLGYAIAFGVVALVQALLAVGLTVGLLGLNVAGPLWALALVAVVDAVLGTTLGLFVSAFANTEFQAVQFMPALVIPQILLCGLFVPRAVLPDVLHADLRRAAFELCSGLDAATAALCQPDERLLARLGGDQRLRRGDDRAGRSDAEASYQLTSPSRGDPSSRR